MNLSEFFKRLRDKSESIKFDHGTLGVTMIEKALDKLADEASKRESDLKYEPRDTSAEWSTVLRFTKYTDFFNEFKGDEDLGQQLSEFLGPAGIGPALDQLKSK